MTTQLQLINIIIIIIIVIIIIITIIAKGFISNGCKLRFLSYVVVFCYKLSANPLEWLLTNLNHDQKNFAESCTKLNKRGFTLLASSHHFLLTFFLSSAQGNPIKSSLSLSLSLFHYV